jgi:hypothetical protein
VQWVALMAAGIAVAIQISVPFMLSVLALWVMGCVYNIPPVRSKDLPYVDVLSEAVNNPIRMLAGWFIVDRLDDRALIAAAELLDDRVLLHGTEAVRRVPQHQRSGAGGARTGSRSATSRATVCSSR